LPYGLYPASALRQTQEVYPRLCDVLPPLERRYAPLFSPGPSAYPLKLFPLAPGHTLHLSLTKELLLPAWPPAPRSPHAFNGSVYVLDSFSPTPESSLVLRPGHYFDSLDSAEALELELLHTPHHLPLRDRAHALAAAEPWLSGAGRAAAVGVSTLLAWPTPSGYEVLLARLGPKAHPHRQGLLHVAPAGMFSPSSAGPSPVPAQSEAELSPPLGVATPGSPPAERGGSGALAHSLPAQLHALIAQELEEELGLRLADCPGAQLRLTGLAFNLLNLRPEICALLVLAHPIPLRLSQEYDGPPLVYPAAPPVDFFARFDAGAITPPGAGALYLGLSALMP